jgi:hypothetical protein
MLFLRGRGARGLRKQNTAQSIPGKLALSLVLYALFGLFAIFFVNKPIFVLSAYLHATSFIFLGMFVAASTGEVLFNKEEGEILLHRPVTPTQLLWAKVRVLTQVSLWLAGAFNLAGFFVGLAGRDGNWLFPFVHALSTMLEAIFCVSTVVVVYQLCLRFAGRERLEAMMTATQVVVAVASILAGQVASRLISLFENVDFNWNSWWVALLPPAWFAGFDDALAGTSSGASLILAVAALGATALVAWLAFSRLASDYAGGLQNLNETPPKTVRAGSSPRRYLDFLVNTPPLRWWLRDPVERASFLLIAAYLWRDRDVKLRVYPGIAPMFALPLIILLPQRGNSDDTFGFGALAFASSYLAMAACLGLDLLRYSQHWQAADIFRCAPIPGPAKLCLGASRAAMVFLAGPAIIVFALIAILFVPHLPDLLVILPAAIALPVVTIGSCVFDPVIPLSHAPETSGAANRFLVAMFSLLVAGGLTGLTYWSWKTGWFVWFLIGETLICVFLYSIFRRGLVKARWSVFD